METSREQAAGTIRLRYSRQFQSGGQTHTVDAECLLPVGASQEAREQVTHELELSVEQLVRQVVQRGAKPTEVVRPQAQAPGRPATTIEIPHAAPAETPRSAASQAPASASHTPVSESMPSSPAASGERKIKLSDFINAITKHWNMSPQEAMKLLNVRTLDGLNYREAFQTLRIMVERKNAGAGGTPNVPRSTPITEAPRVSGQNPPSAPGSGPRPAGNQPTNMAISSRVLRQATTSRPITDEADTTSPPLKIVPAQEQDGEATHKPQPGVDFAGSSKAPIPIQFGTVRDLKPHEYKFEEEEEDELEENDEPVQHEVDAALTGRLKLNELKDIRGNTAASAARMKVLANVIDSQISSEQLQTIMHAAWGITTVKKLKTEQIEALISWAKEDSFVEEVEAVLAWIEEGEA